MARGQQNVVRFYVAVNDTIPVREVERICNFARNPKRNIHRQRAFALNSLTDGLALYIWHYIEEISARGARVVERKNVRMLKLRGCPYLTQESVGRADNFEIGPQNLERNPAVVANVTGEKDVRHPAATDLVLDRVPIAQFRPQPLEKLVHVPGERPQL
jgi:hypothetical protein